MAITPPKIDTRTAEDIARQVRELLPLYVKRKDDMDNLVGVEFTGPLANALIEIFARYAEIIIERLNQVPEKNFLAFLDLLGAAPLPPQPARVPLTFGLVPGSSVGTKVLAGTQVAAQPGEGESEPVIYETERELSVSAARLLEVLVVDPQLDKFSDHAALLGDNISETENLFLAHTPIAHQLFIGHDVLLGDEFLQELQLDFDLSQALGDDATLEWAYWNGSDWSIIPQASDRPNVSGNVNLAQTSSSIIIAGLPAVSQSSVDRRLSRWLRLRLQQAITPSIDQRYAMVRESALAAITALSLTAHVQRHPCTGLTPLAALANQTAVEPTQEFAPFGDTPKLYDAVYLASEDAFSRAGAEVKLEIELANSHHIVDAASVWPSSDLRIRWEAWNGIEWKHLGESDSPLWLSPFELDPYPTVTAEDSIVLTGRVRQGVSLSILRHVIPNLTGAAAIPFAPTFDGQYFAVTTTLVAGLNWLRIESVGGAIPYVGYAVIFLEIDNTKRTIHAEWPTINQPVSTETIDISITIINETEDEAITDAPVLELYSGRQFDTATGTRTEQMFTGILEAVNPNDPNKRQVSFSNVPLDYGRNELRIECEITVSDGTNTTTKWASANTIVSREQINDAPTWLTPFYLDPLTDTTTIPELTLTGCFRDGVSLVVDGQVIPLSIDTPTLGDIVYDDPRFSIDTQLVAGYNVFTITATGGRVPYTSYAVIYLLQEDATDDPIRIVWDGSATPIDTDTIDVSMTIIGGIDAILDSVKLTSGRTGVEYPVNDISSSLNPRKVIIPNVVLEPGSNSFLVIGEQATVAKVASTFTIDRVNANTDTSLVDGTYGFSQSGMVSLTLPNATAARAISGVESYWLRARIVASDYGKPAGYRLKDPTKPNEGFILERQTLRPPVVAAMRIGYSYDATDVPQYALADNFGIEDVTSAIADATKTVAPFTAVDDEFSSVYFGFDPPLGQPSFPNRTISLYTDIRNFAYGENEKPISPTISQQVGQLGSTVVHAFQFVNLMPNTTEFALRIIGTSVEDDGSPTGNARVYLPSLALGPEKVVSVTLEPEATVEVEVQVDLPIQAEAGENDYGFLSIVALDATGEDHGAFFITQIIDPIAAGDPPTLNWQYWNGNMWTDLAVRDDTRGFSRAGEISFLPPSDITPSTKLGKLHQWLRLRLVAGQYFPQPKLDWVRLNTTMASQVQTVRDEVLGSSDGTADQEFRARRAPVLPGQQLLVREGELPPSEERKILEAEEGEDAIGEVITAANGGKQVWVRWHEVTDFYASTARDRHYTVDRQTGTFRFGDGARGMIPPLGNGNIRLAQYQTGGGTKGNKESLTATQLKTSVPYIDKVGNLARAEGGAEAEPQSAFLERAPRQLRHRERAVTIEDYQDLAILASPGVARSLCVPLVDLKIDPDAKVPRAGISSVIIVPHSQVAKPLPSQQLINTVSDYLSQHSLPTAQVVVVGPEYVRVDVDVEIGVTSLEGISDVDAAVRAALDEFLHPLTGGVDGTGWDFGRQPHKSDIYALLEGVSGVDHIRLLQDIVTEGDRIGKTEATGRFLVYSGNHTINITFVED